MLFRPTVTLLSASVMVLSACGADTAGPSASCLSAEGRQSLTVTARDDRFDPACIDAAAGGEIRLIVRNDGRHPHNLMLESGDSVSVDSAQVAFLTAQVGSEGLDYVCTIHPGMRGRIRVSR